MQVEENEKLIEMKKEQKIYEDEKRLIEIDDDGEGQIHEEEEIRGGRGRVYLERSPS